MVGARAGESHGLNFLGIDLAWGYNNPSGLACLFHDDKGCRLVTSANLVSDTEIIHWIRECGRENVWVGIDAPIIAKNPPGTSRPVDKAITAKFGRFHAGVYPANRIRCARPVTLSEKLARRGFSPNPLGRRRSGRRQLEIFPHLVQVGFFGRERIIKYKKGTVGQKRAGMAELQRAIGQILTRQRPPLLPSPALRVLLNDRPEKHRGAGLKALEDRLDALLCAYMTAFYWTWGTEKCEVVGDVEQGYIIAPRMAPG